MIPYTPPRAAKTIPIVDFSGSFSPRPEERNNVAWEVHKACREIGFFYVANHRVPQALVDAQFDAARRFYALPLEVKMRLHMKKSPSTAGYEPIGGQVLDSQDAAAEKAPPDLKESFYCAMELPDEHPWARKCIRGFGHNQWPEELAGFREQTLAYQAAMRELGRRVLAMLARSLDLPEEHLPRSTTCRARRCACCATRRIRRRRSQPARRRRHTDLGGVTRLRRTTSAASNVRSVDGEWIQAPPVRGSSWSTSATSCSADQRRVPLEHAPA